LGKKRNKTTTRLRPPHTQDDDDDDAFRAHEPSGAMAATATLTSTSSVFIRGRGMRATRRMTTTSQRPGGGPRRKMTLRTTCEIRTRDAVQRAAAVLEMSEKVGFLSFDGSVARGRDRGEDA